MPETTKQRVEKRRQAMREAGLRPLQIWVPDSRRPGFAAACHAQSLVVANADAADAELQDFLDAAVDDVGDGA